MQITNHDYIGLIKKLVKFYFHRTNKYCVNNKNLTVLVVLASNVVMHSISYFLLILSLLFLLFNFHTFISNLHDGVHPPMFWFSSLSIAFNTDIVNYPYFLLVVSPAHMHVYTIVVCSFSSTLLLVFL